jgi:hypothetical protein
MRQPGSEFASTQTPTIQTTNNSRIIVIIIRVSAKASFLPSGTNNPRKADCFAPQQHISPTVVLLQLFVMESPKLELLCPQGCPDTPWSCFHREMESVFFKLSNLSDPRELEALLKSKFDTLEEFVHFIETTPMYCSMASDRAWKYRDMHKRIFCSMLEKGPKYVMAILGDKSPFHPNISYRVIDLSQPQPIHNCLIHLISHPTADNMAQALRGFGELLRAGANVNAMLMGHHEVEEEVEDEVEEEDAEYSPSVDLEVLHDCPQSALSLAVRVHGSPEFFRMLILHGADVFRHTGGREESVLRQALYQHQWDPKYVQNIIDGLKRAAPGKLKEEINYVDRSGGCLMQGAIDMLGESLVEQLLDAGADPNLSFAIKEAAVTERCHSSKKVVIRYNWTTPLEYCFLFFQDSYQFYECLVRSHGEEPRADQTMKQSGYTYFVRDYFDRNFYQVLDTLNALSDCMVTIVKVLLKSGAHLARDLLLRAFKDEEFCIDTEGRNFQLLPCLQDKNLRTGYRPWFPHCHIFGARILMLNKLIASDDLGDSFDLAGIINEIFPCGLTLVHRIVLYFALYPRDCWNNHPHLLRHYTSTLECLKSAGATPAQGNWEIFWRVIITAYTREDGSRIDYRVVLKFLKVFPEFASLKDHFPDKMSPLHWVMNTVTRSGSTCKEILRCFANENGCDPNTLNATGRSPLWLLLERNPASSSRFQPARLLRLFLQLFPQLLDLEACHPKSGETPLLHVMNILFESHLFKRYGDPAVFSSHGVGLAWELTAAYQTRAMPMYWKGNEPMEAIRQLIEHGANPNNVGTNFFARPPLHLATAMCCCDDFNANDPQLDMFNYLTRDDLPHPVDLNLKDRFGNMAIHLVCGSGPRYKANIIAALGNAININIRDANGCTPLHLVCKSRNLEGLRQLLPLKPNLGLSDNHGLIPLQLLVSTQREDVYLLQNYAIPNSRRQKRRRLTEENSRRAAQCKEAVVSRTAALETTIIEMIYLLVKHSFKTHEISLRRPQEN